MSSDATNTSNGPQTELEALRARVAELENARIEHGRVENALRESEERFRLLYERSPVGYHSLDDHGHIIEVNPAWLRALGFTHDEVIGHWFGDFLAPGCQARFEASFRRFKAEGEIHGALLELVRKDGRQVSVKFDGRIGYDGQGDFQQTHCVMREVPERRRTEDALRHQIDELFAIFNGIDGAVYVADLETYEVLAVNEYIERDCGRDLLGRKCYEAFQEGQCGPCPFCTNARLVGQGGTPTPPVVWEFQNTRNQRWYQCIDRAIHWPDDRLVRMEIAVDITERKRAEEALREAAEHYRTLFELSPSGILIEDLRGCILDVNPAVCRSLGYTREELIGKQVGALSAAPAEEIQRHIGEILEGAAPSHEAINIRRDGAVCNMELRETALHLPDGSRGVLVVCNDVTERKRVEENLRLEKERAQSYLNIAGVALVAIDVREEVTLINRKGCEILGYDEGDIVGQNWFDRFIPQSIREPVRAVFVRLMAGEMAPAEYFENPVLTASGEERLMAWHNTVLRDETGRPTGTLSSGADITERKRAEQELAQYRDHLEDLVEQRTRELEESREYLRRAERLAALGTLAAGIAHEINNPLGTMLLGVDAALESLGDRQAIERLLRQNRIDMERCGRIVQGMLRFARQRALPRRPLDLNEVVHNAVDFTREYTRKHKVTVRARLADGLALILASPTELEQVGINLIHNAVHACADGGQVTIATDARGDNVRLIVQDDGGGMTAEQIERAFDPFYTTRQEQGGTGLGLAIVHGIVSDHGGTIDIASEEGKGARFTLEFPQHRAVAAEGV